MIVQIEPRDPLITRDGRPVGIGGRIASMDFPPPSVLAGALRARLASVGGRFDCKDLDALVQIPVHGPLLVQVTPESELQTGGEPLAPFAPAPRDADFAADAETKALWCRPRRPHALGTGEFVDGLSAHGLIPAGVETSGRAKGKPPRAPAFWRWSEFESWLLQAEERQIDTFDSLGLPALETEGRVHVSIVEGERVGIDGGLFSTRGLRFLALATPNSPVTSRLAPRQLALACFCPGGEIDGRRVKPRAELAPLGGERRLARWSPSAATWPTPPSGLLERIAKAGRARLVLLTPAHFTAGCLPGWSGGVMPGTSEVTARVVGACVDRPQVISGWDLAAPTSRGGRGLPKPTRRLARAGSVYFVELAGGEEQILAALRATWMQPVSDDPQSRRDGFGLAVFGTWEGGE